MKKLTYEIGYYHNGCYKSKKVVADSVEHACKKARLNKSIIDIDIVEYRKTDKYLLRDF